MLVEQQLEAVVRAGLFRDRQHALQEALQTFFSVRPQLRTEAAIELFRSGEISFLRAAEMAGLDVESFRLLLRDRAIAWEIEAETAADMDAAIQGFFGGTAGVIVADTNIVSTFARVQALPLLVELVAVGRLHITAATFNELSKAVEVGCAFLSPVLEAMPSGGELELVALTEQESLAIKDLPGSLGAGEAESLAVCLHRTGTRLLTNDKRARNYCREKGIPCLDLPGILRAFWVQKVLTKKKVKQLIRQIETEQGMVIKNKEEILK